jgi:hypothetical protein
MNWLEKGTSAAVLLVAVLGSVELGIRLHARWTRANAPPAAAQPQRPPTYAKGDTLPVVAGLPNPSRNTMLVVVRSGCRYCDASMDFYKQLLASSPKEAVLFVSYEPVDRTTQYLSSHGITGAQVTSVPDRSLKVPGTPSIVMIDPARRVQGVWIGKLSTDQEKEVLQAWPAGD